MDFLWALSMTFGQFSEFRTASLSRTSTSLSKSRSRSMKFATNIWWLSTSPPSLAGEAQHTSQVVHSFTDKYHFRFPPSETRRYFGPFSLWSVDELRVIEPRRMSDADARAHVINNPFLSWNNSNCSLAIGAIWGYVLSETTKHQSWGTWRQWPFCGNPSAHTTCLRSLCLETPL